MIYFIFIFSLLTITLIRKLFSNTFLNPTGIFCFIWISLILLMSILAPNFFLSYQAVFYILIFFVFFLFGEFLSFSLIKESRSDLCYRGNYNATFNKRFKKYTIIVSLISLFGSLFYLKAFINHFGSFSEFLVAGALIREDLFEGNIQIPTLAIFSMLLSYTAINLSMVYYAKYGFYWFQIIPFISVLISAFSQAARAGIVIMIFQLLAGKIFKLINEKKVNIEFKLVKPFLLIVPILILIFSLVESFRHQDFEVQSSNVDKNSSALNSYTFGGVSGFTTYLEEIYNPTNDLTYGRYTFSSLYNLLGIANAEPGVYDQYLKVSPTQSVNIYSIFRPLLEDFGLFGFLVWALILGLFSNVTFRYSLRGSLISISICISIYIYLMFSFIAPLTQFNSYIFSCFISPLIIHVSKFKLITFNSIKNNNS